MKPWQSAATTAAMTAFPFAAVFGAVWWLDAHPRPEIEVRDGVSYFHGYRCTEDCSGHKAGWLWAKEHGIDDPDMCSGRSESFKDGCKIFALELEDYEERQAEREPRP
jgi:hypothetical protein